MTENLMIQFVYPNGELPEEIRQEVETIDHSKIMPIASPYAAEADVLVCDGWERLGEVNMAGVPVVVRTARADFIARHAELVPLLETLPRVNVVFTDPEKFTDDTLTAYRTALDALADAIERIYTNGKSPQLNLLTDRMMLDAMNNCGSGDTSVTLAPDGKFYACPGFCDSGADSFGDLDGGLHIPNKEHYRLDHAPICSHCDAWHCKRCVWLNRRLTLEVNTPSRQQCVTAHTERAASARLLNNIRKRGTFLPERGEIKELDYIDPFDKHDTW